MWNNSSFRSFTKRVQPYEPPLTASSRTSSTASSLKSSPEGSPRSASNDSELNARVNLPEKQKPGEAYSAVLSRNRRVGTINLMLETTQTVTKSVPFAGIVLGALSYAINAINMNINLRALMQDLGFTITTVYEYVNFDILKPDYVPKKNDDEKTDEEKTDDEMKHFITNKLKNYVGDVAYSVSVLTKIGDKRWVVFSKWWYTTLFDYLVKIQNCLTILSFHKWLNDKPAKINLEIPAANEAEALDELAAGEANMLTVFTTVANGIKMSGGGGYEEEEKSKNVQ